MEAYSVHSDDKMFVFLIRKSDQIFGFLDLKLPNEKYTKSEEEKYSDKVFIFIKCISY